MLRTRAGALLLGILTAGAALGAAPGRLPLQMFTSAEGLASDGTTTVFSDSRGYLWIGTSDGLSRFDGQHFVNYSVDDGLPHRFVGDIVEDRNGALWIGTAGGVVRLDRDAPAGRPFTRVGQPKMPYGWMPTLFIDDRGVPWAACGYDLCVHERGAFRIDDSFRAAGGKGEIGTIAGSPSGELWVGTRHGVMRRAVNGKWTHYDIHPSPDLDDADVSFDPAGHLWITTPREAIVVASPENIGRGTLFERVSKIYKPGMTFRDPARDEVIAVIVPGGTGVVHFRRPYWSRDGTMWMGLGLGLLRRKGGEIELLDARAGLPRIGIEYAGEDAAGNLWITTGGFGVLRMTTRGAVTFTMEHGLGDDRVRSIIDGKDALCVTTPAGISCLGADGAMHSAPIAPHLAYQGWGWNQIAVQDDRRQWWVATGEGVVQWSPVKDVLELRRASSRIYTTHDGLPSNDIFRIFEDSKRNLWIGGFGMPSLTRRDAATGRFVSFPEFPRSTPSAFVEDRTGNVWIGLYNGGLVRHRNGRFQYFKDEVPQGFVQDLIIDRKGRLWMAASSGGVARIDDPAADRIKAIRYTHANGLASDIAHCVAETADGRIAIGSTRGLDLLDPSSGRISHLTTADGLPSNSIALARSDREGNLWLGTTRGVARLPLFAHRQPPPPVPPRILSIAVNGVPVPTTELGAIAVSGIRVQYPQRRMTIAFGAPYFDLAQPLRFEYRLSADAQWIDAGARREANYDRLPFGEATFEVRTVNGAGIASPASRVAFDVAAPLWLRPWFLTLAAIVISSAVIFVHRYRVEHVLAIERLRRRVATDLHDDLGSSLSRISILSEVAKESADQHLLDEIGDTARDLVDALGDSIWSVDPNRDDLQSLLSRVRHFAADLLEAKSIALDFRVPPDLASVPLDPERRRALYLILKEALNNIAKHSQARRVLVAGEVRQGHLRLVVEDDGKGFSELPSVRSENGGRGVANMSERARRVGGTVTVESEPGIGTRVSVAVPV